MLQIGVFAVEGSKGLFVGIDDDLLVSQRLD